MIESTEATSPFIEINDVNARFSRHFDTENNNRILFSGIFGIGKTFFLKKFFEQKEDCNTIFISPVKYSVADNKDIFELIKADILFKLFEKGLIKFDEKFEFDDLTHYSQYIANHPLEIIKGFLPLMSMIDSVSEEAIAPLNSLFDLGNFFKDKLKKSKESLEDRANAKQIRKTEWIEKIAEIPGSPFENHFMTQFINEILQNIESDKKNVLVIDDLDRLDPEHIFRILNILSVHNDNVGDKNKFSFSSIILVCDLANIQKIFAHRYGAGVDFDGYIDKFYATEVFHFSNDDAIKVFIEEKIDIELSKNGEAFFKFILTHLIHQGLLSLRRLLKFQFSDKMKLENQLFHFVLYKHANSYRVVKGPSFISSETKSLFTNTDDIEILQIIKILVVIFGDYNSTSEAISSLVKRDNHYLGGDLEFATLSFVLIDRFIQYYQDSNHIYFNENTEQYHDRVALEWPTGKIFENEYRIMLNYSVTNVFDDENRISCFHKKKIHYTDLNNLNPIPVQEILNKFEEILNFLSKKNLQKQRQFQVNNLFNQ